MEASWKREGEEDGRRRLDPDVGWVGIPGRLRMRDMGAEATAKELLRLGLADALELTLLIARKDPRRHPRVAARWLLR
jgi:hypothetical protein